MNPEILHPLLLQASELCILNLSSLNLTQLCSREKHHPLLGSSHGYPDSQTRFPRTSDTSSPFQLSITWAPWRKRPGAARPDPRAPARSPAVTPPRPVPDAGARVPGARTCAVLVPGDLKQLRGQGQRSELLVAALPGANPATSPALANGSGFSGGWTASSASAFKPCKRWAKVKDDPWTLQLLSSDLAPSSWPHPAARGPKPGPHPGPE